MFALDDASKMVETMVRQWCERKLAPRIAALEAGTETPWALMRELATTFGVAGLAEAAAKKRIAKLRAGEAAAGDGKGEGKGGGGLGGEPMMMAVFVKELSRVSPGFAMGWGVSVGLAGGAILAKGTADQLERWGLPLLTVQQIGSWCLTEPGAGSDAFGSMTTTAVPDGDGYRLRGTKTFITNGPGADVFLVYARVDRGEPRAEQGVATFILDRGQPGLTTGAPFKKMGMRDSPTCEVFLDDVAVGPERLLGGREPGAHGRGDTKDSLGTERSGIPAMAWGILERCFDQTVRYVREREQFGRPIGAFQAVQLRVADLYLQLKTVENAVYRLAWMQKQGVRDPAYVNATKALCSQLAVAGALTAIQLHGGYGYMEEYHLEKLARDAKLLELGAGTTDINLLSAARSLIGPEALRGA
ncbi:MAG: acyl-CoA dehydrogenase family protein [Kofleriaceae bacterium]|jgi:alkylation response protein AidB-like acyl-CoA dehydrogenase|nr:acyl-CoA dehydrogenase family protein [Kofleriaceae bacterium]MBP9169016.1 acyl-CoA dehydrogenase family protein [Kofleriaceae bacterium]MBP9858869.1 acyl-CoA dehydrogenase family protein [Kofleriaceae bacterium]